jgi:hypothetical protein
MYWVRHCGTEAELLPLSQQESRTNELKELSKITTTSGLVSHWAVYPVMKMSMAGSHKWLFESILYIGNFLNHKESPCSSADEGHSAGWKLQYFIVI